MTSPNVSVVIPSWNGRKLLEEHLPSVISAAEHYRARAGGSVEILIVEDGGTDDTAEWLQAVHGESVRLVKRRRQGGFARACNTGFEAALGPIVLLLNNDVAVSRDALLHLVPHFEDTQVFAATCKAFEAGTRVVASGGRIGEFSRGFWRVFRNYDVAVVAGNLPEEYPSIIASGGFAAFDLEKVRKLGGFDTLLHPFYWEDVDLSLRAWHRGWKILYEPKAAVWHAASSTIGSQFDRALIRRASVRNRLLVQWIHLLEPSRLTAHGLGFLGMLFASLFRFDGAVMLGMIDAFRAWPEVRKRRAGERRDRVLSDRMLEAIFQRLRQRPDIVIFSSRREAVALN
ncbi:MAG: glycosyltransferase family 2 protein [Acidobacteria bacterium]|nr:glycosyltransferase family 2 protein [Acidobacteriota bacterium]